MPGRARLVYFDPNVFLAYVCDEEGRAAMVAELLRKAAGGDLVIMTSTMSIAEVAYAAEEKMQRSLDDATEKRIDSLWVPGSPVSLVEASRRVLVEARTLIRKNLAADRGRLTPIDAIHLATAMVERVDELATYETNKRE